ncbi:MAG: hypothetical protein NZM42_04275 [Gemmatales bacterium]|nr:hypothetical protein [Gemmatales bacterium]MDW8222605.1 hypothetical protein [Gemmatales bacterium]
MHRGRHESNLALAYAYLQEGGTFHQNALRANPRHPDYLRMYRHHLPHLTLVHASLLNRQAALETAEKIYQLIALP